MLQQDILTSFKAMILVTTMTQPPCPQVVLPPTARWLEPLHISRHSLKLETFSLRQVGTITYSISYLLFAIKFSL